MLSYRSSYRRTAVAALVMFALALMTAVLSLAWLTAASAFFWPVAILWSLPWMLVAIFAGLVALGGFIGLSRDAMELDGRPYYSTRPREGQAGTLARMRRRLLTRLSGSPARLGLWPGEWVQVRSFAEIWATLDGEGRLDGLPFMPEMLRYCGKRHRVFRRVEKINMYFGPTAPELRRLRNAVLLDELRCDGAAHGGCQAACQLIWKEAWLTPADAANPSPPILDAADASRLSTHTKARSPEGEERFACQITELPAATTPLSWRDMRHYWRDLRSRNVRVSPFVTAIALALFNGVQRRTGGPEVPYRQPTDRKSSPKEDLDLKPGELVRVKSRPEIERTLNSASRNRGLWFDREMHRFCGGEFRVASVVRTLVDEASGKPLTMSSPCIVLEGVSGTGEYLALCPQNDLIFWHEIWLERVARPELPSRSELSSRRPAAEVGAAASLE
jgi:hypothetical protein